MSTVSVPTSHDALCSALLDAFRAGHLAAVQLDALLAVLAHVAATPGLLASLAPQPIAFAALADELRSHPDVIGFCVDVLLDTDPDATIEYGPSLLTPAGADAVREVLGDHAAQPA